MGKIFVSLKTFFLYIIFSKTTKIFSHENYPLCGTHKGPYTPIKKRACKIPSNFTNRRNLMSFNVSEIFLEAF